MFHDETEAWLAMQAEAERELARLMRKEKHRRPPASAPPKVVAVRNDADDTSLPSGLYPTPKVWPSVETVDHTPVLIRQGLSQRVGTYWRGKRYARFSRT